MKANIKVPVFKLSVLALLALLRNVWAKMNGNPNFTTPAVPSADMKKQADDLEAAIEAATNGSKEDRVLRDVQVASTRGMLRTQADYVRMVCAGDEAKLVSSGFQLAKKREPLGVPEAPIIRLAQMTGETGAVALRWSTAKGVDSFNVYMTTDDPKSGAKWEHVATTTKARTTVNGLSSYKPYWFAVRAVGTAGQSAMSDPAIGVAA